MGDFLKYLCVSLLALSAPVIADVTYVVNGVNDELRENILSHVDTIQFGPQVRLSPRDVDKVLNNAVANTRSALRPYGYYAPDISARTTAENVVEINIVLGPPVIVKNVGVNVVGPGSGETLLKEWQQLWPLVEGEILNQSVWEDQKQGAIDIANARGYLIADFTAHALEIDLESNTADVRLTYDTGPRFVMGDVRYGEHVLRPGILEYIPRFERGDPYTARLVSRLRTDLWKTGYFTDVQVVEIERPKQDPPAVDLNVQVETELRNRYQGALGYGTDSGPRLQASWSRHPMSSSGDRLDVGLGWQKLDDEFTLHTRYRLPRRNRAREWWDAELTLRFENQDLEFKRTDEDEDFIKIANGDVNERHLRLGRLKLTNFRSGESQLFNTLFLQYLNSERRLELVGAATELQALIGDPEFEHLVRGTDNALSIGAEMELIDVQGKWFNTIGHRDRAWLFTSNEAFGSDVEFTQLYLSTRRSYIKGDRFKFHLRGEIGYTDAKVGELTLDTATGPLNLSLTRLPNFYRFKAGGSMSVRGYGFEQLSNNDVGSNHIITASAEVEYRFLNSWSVATYFDMGNAFNDWDEPELKRGVGVGLRWYSIAGEIRVDVAKALDFEDEPWRLHITIGTPLL